MDMTGLGNVSITPNAMTLLEDNGIDLQSLITKHTTQDYGSVDSVNAMSNDFAFQHETGKAVSVYIVGGQQVVVVTKFNEPITTILINGEDGVNQEITQEVVN